MRDDYFRKALAIVGDPYVLVSMTAGRVKILRRGNRPLVESFETRSLEDVALREIIEDRITYVFGDIVVQENFGTRERAANGWSSPPTSTLIGASGRALAAL
jgi:DNA-directed RNA polymerase subunit omega